MTCREDIRWYWCFLGTLIGDVKHVPTCQDLMVSTRVTRTTQEQSSSVECSVRILYALATYARPSVSRQII